MLAQYTSDFAHWIKEKPFAVKPLSQPEGKSPGQEIFLHPSELKLDVVESIHYLDSKFGLTLFGHTCLHWLG